LLQVVLMYKSGDEHNEQALDAVLQAEISVQEFAELGISDDASKLAFKKCDAYEGKNLLEMEAKGLTQFPTIFVAIDGQGMEKYVREEVPTGEKFTDYLITKLEPTTDEDVFPYSEDLITDQYPVFVKFFEQWCSRCVSMKKAFENAATRMAGKVIFMEVECSASDSAQEFCTKHNVDGYPTVKLMGGKLQKALFFERDRSVQVKTNEREGGGRLACWRAGRFLCAFAT
jgi:thiol-disulfide isomerase/thioredoxin